MAYRIRRRIRTYRKRRMPRRASVRRTYRRTYRRRKPRVPIIMPRSCLRRFRYCQTIALTSPDLGTPVMGQFRANDLYDPYVTGAGHQPMGFDQLAALYTSFVVIGSRIKVTPVINTTASVAPAYMMIVLHSQATSMSGMTIEEIMENESTSKKRFMCSSYQFGQMLSGNLQRLQRMNFSLRKFFHRKDLLDNDFACSASSSPTLQAYYSVMQWISPGSVVESGEITYMVEIEYIAVCQEPTFSVQS